MKDLQQTLGYSFENTALLENALTHSSCANESRGRLSSNERLEFLGDSILAWWWPTTSTAHTRTSRKGS